MLSLSHPGTVILADDDDASRLIAQLTLERAGFDVVAVADGAEAWSRAQSQNYCALVLDVHMPSMTGLEVAMQVRHWESMNGVPARPILALTASAMDGEKAACIAAGMNDVITKPFALHALADKVRFWCG